MVDAACGVTASLHVSGHTPVAVAMVYQPTQLYPHSLQSLLSAHACTVVFPLLGDHPEAHLHVVSQKVWSIMRGLGYFCS